MGVCAALHLSRCKDYLVRAICRMHACTGQLIALRLARKKSYLLATCDVYAESRRRTGVAILRLILSQGLGADGVLYG